MSKTNRRYWEKRALNYLRKQGPRSTPTLIQELNVPPEKERTFYRAIEDLKDLKVLKENNGLLYPYGHEEPEVAKVSVGPRVLRVEIPIKRQLAKRILGKRPFIRRLIEFRRGLAYEFLSEAGLLEKKKK